jgi:hypothetical protein
MFKMFLKEEDLKFAIQKRWIQKTEIETYFIDGIFSMHEAIYHLSFIKSRSNEVYKATLDCG